MITHHGIWSTVVTWNASMGKSSKSACDDTRSPTMMPTVFWASLVRRDSGCTPPRRRVAFAGSTCPLTAAVLAGTSMF